MAAKAHIDTPMQRGAAYSALLHIAVILLAFFGLPKLMREPAVIDTPIPVEVVTIADKTSPPKSEAKPQPEQAQKPIPTPPAPPLPEPPKPQPQKAEAPSPTPPTPEPPKPEQQPPEPQQQAAVPQPPEPEPAPVQSKPEPKPEPQPKQEATAAPIVPEPPKAKPKPPPTNTLQSILKSVENMKPQAQPDPAQKVIKQIAQTQAAAPAPSLDNKMTISEIDAVRRQIERCWNVPAGAKDAKNLIIEIHVAMNPDGTVRQATITDQARMGSDNFFRAAAESAYRAIYLCQPLKLPPDKYSVWQDMTLRFDPSDILG